MPRPRRIEVKNGIYHLYNRFVGGESFFLNDEYFFKFVNCFKQAAEFYNIKILVYLCMTNHFHSIIKISGPFLSKFIQKYSTNFARWVNIKLDRRGHVFQGRHKTQIIDSEKYLKTGIAYIYYNPVRAGIVSRIEDYKWSNFDELINPVNFLKYKIVYNLFDPDVKNGLNKFVKWIYSLDINENRDKIDKKLRGQFIMDIDEKENIFNLIDRRNQNLEVMVERRKNVISFIFIPEDRLYEILERIELNQATECYRGVWRSKKVFKKHLKWYLLRNLSRLSITEISQRDMNFKYHGIVSALNSIKHDHRKQKCIVSIYRLICKYENLKS